MLSILRHLISRWVPTGQTTVGKVLRWPLQAVPAEAEVRVLTGPNRGFRWIAGSSVHGCWIGNYERNLADLLWSSLSPGDVFYDIGANAGYYTLLGSRAVGPQGDVVAFEPVPDNLSKLRKHLLINEITNVDVVGAAVLDQDGEVRFAIEGSPSQGRVSTDGSLSVPAQTLDSLTLSPPDVVKMDVEGAEAAVLRGGLQTLQEHEPLLIFSTHGEQLRRQCYEILTQIGYRVMKLGTRGSDHVAEPAG